MIMSLEDLVLDGSPSAEFVGHIVKARGGKSDGYLLISGILPEPPVNAREWGGQRSGRLAAAPPFLVALRVAAGSAVRLRMQLVAHGGRRLPRVEQRFALVESILVFHPLVGRDPEGDGFLFERAFVRDDDRLTRRSR